MKLFGCGVGLFLMAAATPGMAPASGPDSMERLEFLVGEWSQVGVMRAESFGQLGGEYAGPTSCAFGPWQAWMECDFRADSLAGLGPYAVHVVIVPADEEGHYRSYVINNHGTSLYDGEWNEDGELVFTAGSRSARQRVSYRPMADGRVRFLVHESKADETDMLPHTDAYWIRER